MGSNVPRTRLPHEGGYVSGLGCGKEAGRRADILPPYVGGRGWIGVRLDGAVDWAEIAELCEDAYRTVAPTSLVALLDS